MGKLSVETEYDKAITALAVSLANCYDAKCNGAKCATCATKQQQDNVYNSMADLDKLRVQNEVGELVARRHQPRATQADLRRASLSAVWDCRGTIIGALITLFVVFVLPYILWCDTSYNKIQDTLKQTTLNIRDVNYDAKINCMDYAIVFKRQWDSKYNPDDCELVRNLSTNFNHLFVRIKQNGSWVYVEPSAYFYGYIDKYTMKEFWEDMYDSRYNLYGETEYWMRYDYDWKAK